MAKTTFKTFKAAADKWYTTACEVRDNSHPLAVAGFGLFQQEYNTEALNYLLGKIISVRGFNVDAFVKYVFYCTGGHTGYDEKEGMPLVDPDQSFLRYDVNNHTFKVKKIVLSATEKALPDDELTLAVAAKQEAREQIMQDCVQKAKSIKWWELAPKTPANPYSIKSLFSAVRKANDNTDKLTAPERKLVAAMLETASVQGFGEQVGLQ